MPNPYIDGIQNGSTTIDIYDAALRNTIGQANGLATLDANGKLPSTQLPSDTTTSISGNPISISGLKTNQLAKDPIITLEPIQAGSGTPSPSNIRAISGYDKIEVLSCGKNIFNGTYSVTGKFLMADGSEYAGTYNISQYISVKANTAYYFSNLSGTTSACICWYNKAKEFISSQSITAGFTSTSPANACYVRASVHNARTDVCINEGNTAITFEPYHKTTDLSESLGQTVYKGSLDIRTGLFTVTCKAVDMANMDWQYSSGLGMFYCYLGDFQLLGDLYCTYYKPIKTIIGDSEDYIITSQYNYYLAYSGAVLKDTRYTDATSLKASLTGQLLLYTVVTPTEIQLTPHEISLLKNYAYVSTNGTNIQFDYHNGELASLADVSQLGETLNALPNFFLPDYANVLSVHSGALEINSSYSEYTAPQNGYIIIAEMYGAVNTSSTPFSPPYFDVRIDQKRVFSTQAFIATNERASGTIIPIAKGSLFQYRVTNKKLNELIIWFAPIKYM